MNNIKKIDELILAQSFIEINFEKGFKFIDKIGVLLNEYATDNLNPNFKADFGEILFTSPFEPVQEFKISTDTIWMSFSEPDNNSSVLDIFLKEAKRVAKIIENQNCNRIGWRNYFVKEFDEKSQLQLYMKNLVKLEDLFPESVRGVINAKIPGKATLEIRTVKRKSESVKIGILFDIDLTIVKEMVIEKVDTEFEILREFLESESGLIKTINQTLS